MDRLPQRAACSPHAILHQLSDSQLNRGTRPKPSSYPPISSIPLTSRERLLAADAAPNPFPDCPLLSPAVHPQDGAATASPYKPASVLYLAYGSNLSAETFLGKRGIRPISRVNVSAPALQLVFDLPAFPYGDPCMANTAPRTIPKPPKLPPNIPDIPDIPDIPHPPRGHPATASAAAEKKNDGRQEGQGGEWSWEKELENWGTDDVNIAQHNDPKWDKGLYGVVYEVTVEDYAHIILTEGGSRGYNDILVPCIPLPAPIRVPEKPPIPEIPRPFLAHTLYAPRIPDGIPLPPGTGNPSDGKGGRPSGGDGGDGPETPKKPRIPVPGFVKRLMLPVRRDDPLYAQPSARYLKLIRDGAAEHALPEDYQAYLAGIHSYTMTTRAQRVAAAVFLNFWGLLVFQPLTTYGKWFADGDGIIPLWLYGVWLAMMHFMWDSHDYIFKPLFGDGERTIGDDWGQGEEERSGTASRWQRGRWWRSGLASHSDLDEEKRGLLEERAET